VGSQNFATSESNKIEEEEEPQVEKWLLRHKNKSTIYG